MRETIPVFFTFDHHYVLPAKVAFWSMLRHASGDYDYRLYVIHTDLTESHREGLRQVVGQFANAAISFIDATRYDDDASIAKGKKHFSRDIYYKLMAASLFPEYDRVICSDVDVVFLGDIAPSYFAHPDKDFYYAGVGQVLESDRMSTYGDPFTDAERDVLRHEIYAGYILFNLAALRAADMEHTLTTYYKAHYARLPLPEQDCLILCCWPRVEHLPMAYCLLNQYYRVPAEKARFYHGDDYMPADDEACRRVYDEARAAPVQLHYVGAEKPWCYPMVSKGRVWFACLAEAGLTGEYVRRLPMFIAMRWRRYSLRRFIGKIRNRILSRPVKS